MRAMSTPHSALRISIARTDLGLRQMACTAMRVGDGCAECASTAKRGHPFY